MRSDLSVDQAALAQPDTEPVAWRWHFCADIEWHVTDSEREAIYRRDEGCTVEPLYNAEPQDIWRQSAEVAASDNTSLRKAGTALAEAALRVIREYDGTHRLALAVAGWSKAVANEGGRTSPMQSDASAMLDEIEAAMDRVLERRGFQTTRPDTSAGLIEAAEIAEEHASKYCYDSQIEQGLLRNFAQLLRARAADRSGK